MEFKWQANTPQWRSRTRAARACPTCQRRKKRCRHLAPSSVESQRHPTSSADKLDTTRNIVSHLDHRDPIAPRLAAPRLAAWERTSPALPSTPSTERFVGDLNPEAFIREKLDQASGSRLRDRVGLWIAPSIRDPDHNVQDPRHTAGNNDFFTLPPQSTLDQKAIEISLNQRCSSAMQACAQLPQTTRAVLTAIYFSKINHTIPLLEKDSFIKDQAQGTMSVFLERAICLVAAKDPEAISYLCLIDGGPVVSTRQFCSNIYNGLTVAMDMGLESDRLTCIRVLALMSLHFEGNEGTEAASLRLCQAIHQAQTIGLHLDRPDRTSGDPLVKLFWSLWTLDKMHASIGGRPVILADRDIGIPRPETHTQGAFGVWLAISDLLATVISYYRPSAVTTTGWEEGFPAFEDIVGDGAHGDLDFSTLGILELYYHCVAILSCRYKLTDGFDGTKVSSIRQGLAAVRIHSIVASEFAAGLPPLPIVPYSIALSMGVSYRQLRSSKLITHFNRAKSSLEACCHLLEELSPRWSSAEAMARLGRKALQHIDQEHPQYAQSKPNLVSQSSQGHLARPGPVDLSNNNEPGGSSGRFVADHAPEMPMGSPLPSMSDIDTSMHGFADIDMLFGEFLDLSLPTNFWDPVFTD
ncbi:transcriptional regulator family: Fungal Specific TF [Penicillium lividum]|nr:transcriptional regulator family: Fungal Specific TF [Penicillium lividum]